MACSEQVLRARSQGLLATSATRGRIAMSVRSTQLTLSFVRSAETIHGVS